MVKKPYLKKAKSKIRQIVRRDRVTESAEEVDDSEEDDDMITER